jgi:hypothetical protein
MKLERTKPELALLRHRFTPVVYELPSLEDLTTESQPIPDQGTRKPSKLQEGGDYNMRKYQ